MHFRFRKSLLYCSWWSCTHLRGWSRHWGWMDCPKMVVLWSLFGKDPLLIAWDFPALKVWVHIRRSWVCCRRVLLTWVERLYIYVFIHKGNNSNNVLANFMIIKAWIYQNASTSLGHCGETKPSEIWFNFSVGVTRFSSFSRTAKPLTESANPSMPHSCLCVSLGDLCVLEVKRQIFDFENYFLYW